MHIDPDAGSNEVSQSDTGPIGRSEWPSYILRHVVYQPEPYCPNMKAVDSPRRLVPYPKHSE